jgi:tetratricopeptide (TPR) repeat protein
LGVTLADRGDAERTLIEFITGEYRIVHLAAHGRYDPDPMKSGVIVSDRILITPAEVLQSPLVPEFVFLNCCYLGQMNAEQQPASPDPRLGASLAEGFIQAGVRAVIAAGWAVDDQAGLLFATEFYESFLNGAAFGDAVKAARDKTRRNFPKVNTWGAYQCYGNPEYQFRPAETRRRGVSAPRIVARTEALQALRTMAGDATRVTFGRVKSLTRQFDALHKVLPASWLVHGELLYACGDICGELEQFDRAIKFYRDALHAVPAAVPLVAVEQLANLLARAAATRVIADPAAVAQALQDLDEASKWLDWIDQKLWTTKERWSLRGSLHKRWAACELSGRREHLQRASAAYREAAKLADAEGYQWQNALALDFILAGHDRTSELQQRADSHLETARQGAKPGDRNFWNVIEYPDALLHQNLIHGKLANRDVLKEVTTCYEQARRVGPTPRQWASVRDHIWFLAAMAGDPALECHNPRNADALKTLLSSLINH